jgi:XTP/dITP diphosphohydrolase
VVDLQLVLASANPDKASEITAILGRVPGLTVHPRPLSVPDVEETGDTLVENARLKAFALVEATGMAAVADDTGLEVEALGGRPGVYSARYSGENATYAENIGKLLAELNTVGATTVESRRALFRTVAFVGFPGGSEVWAEGKVMGEITLEEHGTDGFGYDPVFAPDGYDGRTFAQMSPEEKHRISHRGQAFRALAEQLGEAVDPATTSVSRPESREGST